MIINATKLTLAQGDITDEKVDVIVNAANSGLLGGGGVDGAIHRRGGPSILEACKEIRETQGKCPAGEAVITTAGELNANYVVHTVGPFWNGGMRGEAEVLASAYRNSLGLAEERGQRSIAFPSISTGAYRYPIDAAARVALGACHGYASESTQFEEIRFILFSAQDLETYRAALLETA